MPYLTLPIDQGDGPFLDLLFGASEPRAAALKKAGQPVPAPIQVRGLIDTGASSTCVDPIVLSSLNLLPTGKVPILTPSTGNTPHFASQFDVSVSIPHPKGGIRFTAVAVLECHLASQGIQALIGRDILKNCLFAYDGQAGIFTIAF